MSFLYTSLVEQFGLIHIINSSQPKVVHSKEPSGTVKQLDPGYMEEYSAFSEFVGKFGRSYATKDEHMTRFEAFRVNYRDIKSHNSRFDAGEVTWTKVIN